MIRGLCLTDFRVLVDYLRKWANNREVKRNGLTRETFDHSMGLELQRLHELRLTWIEEFDERLVAVTSQYPNGYRIPIHQHSRAQLMYAPRGVITVDSAAGRWMVPPEHAMWIPAGIDHAIEIIGTVQMYLVYVKPDVIPGLPSSLRVVGLTELVRSLILEAVTLAPHPAPLSRDSLLMELLLQEIPRLPERPLSLRLPADPELAALCQQFLESPSPHATIDNWADTLALSRRTFTRVFRRETGLSFSLWRQQACLFAALPRLAAGEPVTTVALDLGYENAAAFTTMFKRMLGASPRHYRQDAGAIVTPFRQTPWDTTSRRATDFPEPPGVTAPGTEVYNTP